jgi:hypothetical protein
MVISNLFKGGFTGVLASALLIALASVPANASSKTSVLAFGLFGAKSVFESEAKGAAVSSRSGLTRAQSSCVPTRKDAEM